jgi:glycosyltransferase involved in cell wall biosynthesis
VRVVFISKPIAPPFHDGTKCLVRDVATRLERVEPIVLSVRGAPALRRLDGGAVRAVPVYSDGGSFTPAIAQNLRAAAWLLLRSRADLWHFVYAPNPRTSHAGRWLSRRKRLPVVQTIASSPRSFQGIERLLFGHAVVAQSRFTLDKVQAEYDANASKRSAPRPAFSLIPPPVSEGITRSAEQAARARHELGIDEGAPLFVYPGDLEVSSGAEATAQIAERVRAHVPAAVVVIAYRRKTPAAAAIAEQLRTRLTGQPVRFIDSSPDVLSLIASATAVLFPVDDLWGKVDLPIVLLEAMALGVPVLALDRGPLAELGGAELVPTLEPARWLRALTTFAEEPAAREACIEAQRRGVLERCQARHVARAYEELYLELIERWQVEMPSTKMSLSKAAPPAPAVSAAPER